MKIVISETAKEACISLTENMIGILKSISGRDVYIALSGGKTPELLYDLWARQYEHEIDWKRIQVFWVDERCVPPADRESNYHMAVLHFLSKLPLKEKNIHRIHGESEPEREAERYSEIVRRILPWEGEIPVFDIILLGAGSDGHTASLFPELTETHSISYKNAAEEEEEGERDGFGHISLYKVAENPYSGQKRITMTFPLINQASHIFLLVTGSEKQEMVCNLIHGKEAARFYPVARVKPVRGDLTCFLDRDSVTDVCLSAK